MRVPPSLIKRTKQHFHSLPEPLSVDIIFGTNGYIWISAPRSASSSSAAGAGAGTEESEDAEMRDAGDSASASTLEAKAAHKPTAPNVRERICRVRNSIVALSRANIPIYRDTVLDVYEVRSAPRTRLPLTVLCSRQQESLSFGLPAKDILNPDPDALLRLTQKALARQVA